MAKFDDWTVWVHGEPSARLCFAEAEPKSRRDGGLERDAVHVYVSNWVKTEVAGEVSVKFGYALNESAPVTVRVGSEQFRLYANDTEAFVDSPQDEKRLVEAMKRGSSMVVQGRARNGASTADEYSLAGSTAAIERAAQECSRERVAELEREERERAAAAEREERERAAAAEREAAKRAAWNDCAASDANRAIAGCTRVLDDRSDSRRKIAFRNRGVAYHSIGAFDQAIADFNQALRLDRMFTAAHVNRGLAYQRKGDAARAADAFRAALVLPAGSVDGDWAHRTARAQLAAIEEDERRAAAEAASPGAAQATVPGAAAAGRRVALVIGNSAYQAVPRLPNPRRDGATIAETLRRLGFAEVELLTDLSKPAMERALIDFSERALGADWAVVYYAGHGIEMDGQNYLIPIEARLRQDRHVRLETVSLEDVLEAAGGARQLRLVILDACRDNPFLARMARADATRSIGRGLARVEPAGGTLVAYAAKEGQVALDGDGDNSPFVEALVRYLAEPGLEVGRLFRRVRSDVLAATGGRQEPFTYGSLPDQDFYFVAR